MNRRLLLTTFLVVLGFVNLSQAETVRGNGETKLPATFFETSDRFEKLQLIEQLSITEGPTDSDELLADSDDTLNIADVRN